MFARTGDISNAEEGRGIPEQTSESQIPGAAPLIGCYATPFCLISNDRMKYLIAGLGNIGAEYADTRHNIGFRVVDALAETAGAAFVTGRYGAVAEVRHKGRTLVLLKPSTYMNLSGKAVRYWLEAEKIPLENLLVVVDDIALPFGTLRMRTKGSAGGHNGLKSITELLGTEAYARMRFGVGGDFARGHQVDYVLGEWTAEEREALPARLKLFGDAVLSFAAIGAERTMNLYNKK